MNNFGEMFHSQLQVAAAPELHSATADIVRGATRHTVRAVGMAILPFSLGTSVAGLLLGNAPQSHIPLPAVLADCLDRRVAETCTTKLERQRSSNEQPRPMKSDTDFDYAPGVWNFVAGTDGTATATSAPSGDTLLVLTNSELEFFGIPKPGPVQLERGLSNGSPSALIITLQ